MEMSLSWRVKSGRALVARTRRRMAGATPLYPSGPRGRDKEPRLAICRPGWRRSYGAACAACAAHFPNPTARCPAPCLLEPTQLTALGR